MEIAQTLLARVVGHEHRDMKNHPPGILDSSIMAIRKPTFGFKLRSTALHLRFYSGVTDNAQCALCEANATSNVLHALGGCKQQHTHALVTTRHGGAVHEIARTLKEHTDFAVMEDAEGHTRTAALPTWLIPQGHTLSRPNIVLANPRTAPKRATIIEWFHAYPANLHRRQIEKSTTHNDVFNAL